MLANKISINIASIGIELNFMTFPVSTGAPITATNYNEILDIVTQVGGPNDYGYGRRDFASLAVTTGTRVTRVQWVNIIADINRIHQHQYGSKIININEFAAFPTTATWIMNVTTSISTVSYISIPGFIIEAPGINAIKASADIISTSTYTVHSSQLSPLITNSSTSINTTTFVNTGISHVVQAKWANSTTAKYFFNLGGELRLSVTSTSSTSTMEDVVLQEIMAVVSTSTLTRFGRNDYFTTPISTGTWTVYARSGAFNYVRLRIEHYHTETSVFMALSITNTSTSVTNYFSPNGSNWNNPIFV